MKKILILAAATLALAACDNNDNTEQSLDAAVITATIGESTTSRAVDTEWTRGDAIGISSIVGTVEPIVVGPFINLKYTTQDGDGKFEGKPLYFYRPMTLNAYYPYTGVEGTAPGTDGIIAANTRPENQKPENQQLIDFLWDSKTGIGNKDFSPDKPNVNFTFSHQMCKLTFTFLDTPSADLKYNVEVKDIVAYELLGLGFDGTFDTSTGVCSINDPEVKDSIKFEYTKGSVQHNVALPSIIMFPQKPGNNKVFLRLYLDELNNAAQLQNYTCTLNFGDGELKPGHSYKYTIKVTKVGLIVGEMSIEDWNLDRDVRITATIDGAFDFTDGESGNN